MSSPGTGERGGRKRGSMCEGQGQGKGAGSMTVTSGILGAGKVMCVLGATSDLNRVLEPGGNPKLQKD